MCHMVKRQTTGLKIQLAGGTHKVLGPMLFIVVNQLPLVQFVNDTKMS